MNAQVVISKLDCLILTFENEFSGVIFLSCFRGKQNIFATTFITKFVVKCAAKSLRIGQQIKILCAKIFVIEIFLYSKIAWKGGHFSPENFRGLNIT